MAGRCREVEICRGWNYSGSFITWAGVKELSQVKAGAERSCDFIDTSHVGFFPGTIALFFDFNKVIPFGSVEGEEKEVGRGGKRREKRRKAENRETTTE